jgi:hypothetical protein
LYYRYVLGYDTKKAENEKKWSRRKNTKTSRVD